MSGYPLVNGGRDGVRIKTVGDFHIDVIPMIFNDRIVTVPVDATDGHYTRYWCYQKGAAAILAAEAWDGSEDTEPVGWKKAHGERYPNRGE